MNELTNEDRNWCLRRLPKPVFDAMKKAGPALCLAGGFIRDCIGGNKPSDIDLFTTSKDAGMAWATVLAEGRKIHKTDNAFTIKSQWMPVQIIHRWTFAHPSQVVPSFDFTIACAAIWYEAGKWKSLCDARFYIDMAARRLIYCSPNRNEDAGGSLLRVLKFYQRGYRIPLDSMGAVIARLVMGVDQEEVQRETPQETEAQWSKILTGLLHEVDPNVDPEHESHLSALNNAEDDNA